MHHRHVPSHWIIMLSAERRLLCSSRIWKRKPDGSSVQIVLFPPAAPSWIRDIYSDDRKDIPVPSIILRLALSLYLLTSSQLYPTCPFPVKPYKRHLGLCCLFLYTLTLIANMNSHEIKENGSNVKSNETLYGRSNDTIISSHEQKPC